MMEMNVDNLLEELERSQIKTTLLSVACQLKDDDFYTKDKAAEDLLEFLSTQGYM
jgi:hypothetical protein